MSGRPSGQSTPRVGQPRLRPAALVDSRLLSLPDRGLPVPTPTCNTRPPVSRPQSKGRWHRIRHSSRRSRRDSRSRMPQMSAPMERGTQDGGCDAVRLEQRCQLQYVVLVGKFHGMMMSISGRKISKFGHNGRPSGGHTCRAVRKGLMMPVKTLYAIAVGSYAIAIRVVCHCPWGSMLFPIG